MRKILFYFVVAILLFLALLAYWWFEFTKPPDPSNTETKRFVIPRGLGVSQIGRKLSEEGLIKSYLVFKLYFQLQGKTTQIKAGEYYLSPSEDVRTVVKRLISGPKLLWVTFPEGLRREEIALRLVRELEIKDAENFYLEFMEASVAKEGFLFPDTYLFPKEITPTQVVEILYNNFNRKIEPFASDIQKLGMSLNEVITLASIIERETKTDEERPIVAGILIKRLKAGWPLQVDATVQYAVATRRCEDFKVDCKWWPILSREDINVNSRFNSYIFKGLPPFPIANPGLSSIKAVVYPEDSDYWFYLHDVEGDVHFSKTLEEHQEAVGKYLGK